MTIQLGSPREGLPDSGASVQVFMNAKESVHWMKAGNKMDSLSTDRGGSGGGKCKGR